MKNRYHNLSTAELYSRLDDFLVDDETAIREASRVVQALHAKGEKPEVSKAGPLKWWKDIVEERLHPRAAIALNAFPKIIELLMLLNRDFQEAIANGRSIECAIINSSGDISYKPLRILQIPRKTLAILIDGHSLRAPDKQADMLRAAFRPKAKEEKTIPVSVDSSTDAIKVGSIEVPSSRMALALEALGYTVTRN